MTDNEIIKFMQCVMGNDANCSECRYQKVLPFPSCRMMCAKNALDLINRQKAEIERLREIANPKCQKCVSRTTECAKSEAIKEFAERLKHFIIPQKADGYTREIVLKRDIDNLVKEMTEVENDRA